MTDCVVALGYFDGVHLGHGALLRQASALAEELGAEPAALSFQGAVTGKPLKMLTPPDERRRIMREEYGIDRVIELPFTDTLRTMRPDAFLEMLVREYGARGFTAGYDFRFGYLGAGDAACLRRSCERFEIPCRIVPCVSSGGEAISSGRIRGLLERGLPEEAAALLGRPFSFRAEVLHGAQLGRTLGFPTVNQILPEDLFQPAGGVYVSLVTLPDGSVRKAVTNFGTHPTVGNSAVPQAESFLLDYSGDLYGQVLRTSFLRYLRPEKKFTDLDALLAQMRLDLRSAQEYE